MHICLMNDSFPPQLDGVANAVKNYATLIQSGYGEASVVTPYYPDVEDDYPFPVIRYPSLDTTALVGYRAGVPFSPKALGELEKLPVDLIHSHCPIVSTYLGRILRSRKKVPLVFTYHTKFDIDIANAIRGRHLQEGAVKLLVENITACDEVWVVSRGAGENLRSLGYEGDYILMPNGVDLPRGRVAESAVREATAGFDLPRGTPVFLFVGRMMWYKGLRIILDALQTLQSEGQDFRMVFIGAGGDEAEVRACAGELGLSGRCLFVGPVYDRETLRAWYCRADLFLFPSTFDTNGLVVREAAACSLASVLIRGSCAAEDGEDGENCFLIEENSAAMAACLRALCAQPQRMRQVGQRAAEELYVSWEEAVRGAWERYAVVEDRYRRGLCESHNEPVDELLRSAGVIMDAAGKLRRARQLVTSRIDTLAAGLQWEKQHKENERIAAREQNQLRQHAEGRWERLDRFL